MYVCFLSDRMRTPPTRRGRAQRAHGPFFTLPCLRAVYVRRSQRAQSSSFLSFTTYSLNLSTSFAAPMQRGVR